ncbi:efflux RND transporter periplasmic adaptor subunit [Konateibacter massiliensis]|uniref:efflux RND transporter periplasmic adaptor subunit n=1 Tax=Konateibacter massiliensis TaxID=2002841 RepID=UPI000C15848D|nr:efflux RND transporter periplasmic adaptor subunit [Konateibacter massiliensis]
MSGQTKVKQLAEKMKEKLVTVKEKLGKKDKKVYISLGIAAVLAVSGIVAANASASSSDEENVVYKETQVQYGNLTVGITESGNTSIGTETLDYDVDAVSVTQSTSSTSGSSSTSSSGTTGTSSSTTGSSSGSTSSSSSSSAPALEVEEIYVASSQSVSEGDQILKVTDKSYQKVLKYLEAAVKTAQLNVENENIERALAQNSADYTYKSNTAIGSTSSAGYNKTAQDLEDAVDDASDAIADWEDEVSTFTEDWNEKYYEEYKIDELIANVDKYEALISQYKEEAATLKTQVADLKTQAADLKAQAEVLKTQISSYDATQTNEKTLDELKAEYEKVSADYETANASYKTAKESYATAKSNLSAAKSSYSSAYDSYEAGLASYNEMVAQGETALAEKEQEYDSLKASYDKAVADQTTGLIDAEEALKEDQITSNNASTLYDIETNGIDDDVTDAEETLEEAQEALDHFNALVVDGIVKADFAGTIVSVGYAVGDEISSATAIVTYGNPEDVTISVSVDQEDVAAIAVGDSVNIDFTAYTGTTYEGTVAEIATSPTSERSSTVSYAVTVQVNGDVSALYSGMTANVTFITKEMDNVLYVSNKAIITEDTKTYVKVKDSAGNIEKREVTTGFSDGSNVEIVSGLTEGETALIESQVKSE